MLRARTCCRLSRRKVDSCKGFHSVCVEKCCIFKDERRLYVVWILCRYSDQVSMLAWLLLFLPPVSSAQRSEPVFSAITKSVLPPDHENNPTQLNYGVAVTDVDGDGDLEMFVAGYNGPNLVLKYNQEQKRLVNIAVDNRSSPFYALRDRQGNAIGVTACDIDGDGREEIYVLNTNNAFSGRATYSDKLFKFRNGRFEDLLNDDINEHRDVANRMAGRSVACVDRKGTGRYAIYIANYASGNVGPHALIEMDESASDLSQGVIALSNVAEEAGVNKFTGGRGVVAGPIVSQTLSDVLCVNEYGPNFLFRNKGDGTFTDVAQQAGVEDPMQHGRGVALADFNRDGRTDIVYGNWNGPHRLFMQMNNRKQKFKDIASQKFSMPSPVRTVIAADFDNDNELEVFFNNIAYRGPSANRLFRVSRRDHGDPQIEELNIGEASEQEGRGTGAVATDFDGDGRLELMVSHGESAAQPLSVYKVLQGSTNSWLRVIPRTKFGAFARGAKVVVYTKKSGMHTRIIDGGSGYLCEMEPVAHFGLGKDVATSVEVYWPDGRSAARPLEPSDLNSVLEIGYPRDVEVTPTAQIEMKTSVPTSPPCAPSTVPSASTPTAAISAGPSGDATRASSPATTARPAWPGWLTSEGRGRLRNASGRAFASGCSYHTPPASSGRFCHSRSVPPSLPLSFLPG